jgi:hypothetical protein
MPVIQPPKERHTSQDDGTSLKITIPSRKNYFAILFLGFWLVGWAIGEVVVGGLVILGIIGLLFNLPEIGNIKIEGMAGMSFGGLFILVWLGGWTVGGGYALYTFLWHLAGKENIEINSDSLKIQHAIFGFGKIKEYLATHVKDLRVSPLAMDNNIFSWSRQPSFWGRSSSGLLAFDYGSKTFRFGDGADEAESKQILEKIVSRFPQYRVRKPETG